MLKLVVGTLIFAVAAGITLFAYAACVVASKADDYAEQSYKHGNTIITLD